MLKLLNRRKTFSSSFFRVLLGVLIPLFLLIIFSCKDSRSSSSTRTPTKSVSPTTSSSATSTYTINFDTQGGSTVANVEVEEGEKITVPTNPTRTGGYKFVGWNENADGTGSNWIFISNVATKDMTLYAQWAEDFKTVTFNNNGGSGTTASASVRLGSTIPAPATNPFRTGHKFINWSRNADGIDAVWNFATDTVTEDITLYAKWASGFKTVVFNNNGGLGRTVPASVRLGSTIAAPANPSRRGYKFVGWNKNAAGTGAAWNFAKDSVSANMTLYAKWADDFKIVTFNNNDGSDGSDGENLPTTTPTRVRAGNRATAPANPSRMGYKFVNWNRKADGTGTAWNFVKNRVNASVTLYAQWADDFKMVTFDNSDKDKEDDDKDDLTIPPAKVRAGSTIIAPETTPSRAGYKIINWSTNKDGTGETWNFETDTITEDITLYAIWTNYETRTVTFNKNDGEDLITIPENIRLGSTVAAPAVTRMGYKIVNWNKEASGTGETWNFETDTITEDITLYAIWDDDFKTVTFNNNDGIDSTTSVIVRAGSTVPAPENSTFARHQFINWNRKADGTSETWNFKMDAITEDITLYAQWAVKGQTHKSGDLEPAAPTMAKKAFLGWYTITDFTDITKRVDFVNQPSDDFIIYPKFVDSEVYKVSKDGVLSVVPSTATVEIPYNVDETVVRKLENSGTTRSIFGATRTTHNIVVKEVYLPTKNLNTIGTNAFSNTENLSEITIPGNVGSLDSHAFFGCSNLTDVTFSTGLTTIGPFSLITTSTTTLTIPSTETNIGSSPFSGQIVRYWSNQGIPSKLSSVRVDATTPPAVESDLFYLTYILLGGP